MGPLAARNHIHRAPDSLFRSRTSSLKQPSRPLSPHLASGTEYCTGKGSGQSIIEALANPFVVLLYEGLCEEPGELCYLPSLAPDESK